MHRVECNAAAFCFRVAQVEDGIAIALTRVRGSAFRKSETMKTNIAQNPKPFYENAGAIAVIVIIAAMAGIAASWQAPALEHNARAWLMRWRGNLPPSDELVIVAIDEASIDRLGRFPWPRPVMAQTLDRLSAAQPKAIALDVLFSEATNEADDQALAAAIARAGKVVVAAQLVESDERAVWLRPLPEIERAAAGIAHVNVNTGFDGVARKLMLQLADDEARPLWAMAIETIRVAEQLPAPRLIANRLQLGQRTIPTPQTEAAPLVTVQAARRPAEIIPATPLDLDFIGPAGAFAGQTVSLIDVLEGKIAAERMRGKYVLIGATAAALGDRIASPLLRSANNDGRERNDLMPGVEILANAMQTILHERFYRALPDWAATLLTLLLASAFVGSLHFAQGRFETLKQLFVLALWFAIVLLAAYLAFAHWLIWLPLVPLLVTLAAAAPLALLQRSLALSAAIDRRIHEIKQASATLFAVEKLAAEKPTMTNVSALPRGSAWKAQQLGALAQQLLERAQFVEHSLLSVADGLLVADVQGVIAFANPRAAEMLSVTQRELIGSELSARLVIGESLPSLLTTRTPLERELAIGSRHYTLRVAVVQAEDEAAGFVVTLSDVTRQHELQQARNDVMALVTHELKTPLTAIQGMSGLLAQHEVNADQRREMHLAINDEAKRLARLIDQYLNVTRLESGSQPLRLAPVQVAQLIERTLRLLEPIAAQRGIRLVRRIASDLPAQSLDADLIAQALTNLVSNAIKFSKADSEIIITAHIEAEALHINITDHGCGIPAESLPHVFEKFYRVPDIELADAHGAGLGLSLVREIAELHQGSVSVTSELGQGSVFTLTLPIQL